MRQHKFRQFITREDGSHYWHVWGYHHICTRGLPVFINPLGPVEWDNRESDQFVGRVDSKLVDGYCGDVVKSCDEADIGVVKHGGYDCGETEVYGFFMHFKHEQGERAFYIIDLPISQLADFEIIGNTRDNPELLEPK